MVKILAILQLTRTVHIISFLYDKFVFNGEHCLRLTVKICQFLHLTGTFFLGRFTAMGYPHRDPL